MNVIEFFLLDLNFSWFFSRLSPFFFIEAIAILSCYLIFKRIHFRKKIFKYTFLFLTLILPLAIYFYHFPIYTGDLFDLGEKPKTKMVFPKNKTLILLALSDCPHCHESKVILETLLKRNKNVQIEIWISGDQKDLFYNSLDSKKVKVLHNNEFDKTIYLTQGVFPTYVISKNRKLIKRWTNEKFGARSLDEIESLFEVHK